MTHPLEEQLKLNPKGFEEDPFGYSALAWHKWGIAQTMAGFPVDITKPPTTEDLKSPVLWITQAQALFEAAVCILRSEPNLENHTIYTKGVCHCQFHAVALMLVGLSLEISLKAMIIINHGIDEFSKNEHKFRHHRLHELSEFIPDLSDKDKAILECLTHFIYWAGKYPDPGSGRERDAESIFELSEHHKIIAKELFTLTSKIMNHVQVIIDDG